MNPARYGGFALLDVVVGLTLTGLVALLAHRGLQTLLDVQARAAQARVVAMHGVAVRRQLVSWLHAAAVEQRPAGWSFLGTSGISDAGLPADRISFLTDAPGPFRHGREALVLELDTDPLTPVRGLVAVLAGSDTVEMAPGARGLAVRYLHSLEGERVWASTWESSSVLPEAVEIRVVGDSIPDLLRLPLFVVPQGGR